MNNRRNYGGLDIFRICAALLVIAIHTSPLTSVSEGADFFLTRVLARIAVPFFMMVTGQFVAAGFLNPSVRTTARLHKFLQKTMLLYVFCILLYLPVGIYAQHYADMTVSSALRMVVFDGTFYHLWYFPACILGIFLVHLMSRFLSLRSMTAVSAALYIIGLFGDSYYGLAQKIPALETVYGALFQFFSYTRNGLFMAPLFMVMGMWMAAGTEKEGRLLASPLFRFGGLAISFAAMTGEAFTLRHFELQRHDSMYFALVPVMFFLYKYLLYPQTPSKKELRTAASWIYILHPAFIVAVRGIARPLKMTGILVDNSLIHYIAVALLSTAAGFFISYVSGKVKPSLSLSRIAGNRTARRALQSEEELPYETYEYDTEYQEVSDMQAKEHQNDYESWDRETQDSRNVYTEENGIDELWSSNESEDSPGGYTKENESDEVWSPGESGDPRSLYETEEADMSWSTDEPEDSHTEELSDDSPGIPAEEADVRMNKSTDAARETEEPDGASLWNTKEWQGIPNAGPDGGKTADKEYLPYNTQTENIPTENMSPAERNIGPINVPGMSKIRSKTVASARYQYACDTDNAQPEESERYANRILDGADMFAETREFVSLQERGAVDSAIERKEIDADDYIIKIMSGSKTPGKQAATLQARSSEPETDMHLPEKSDTFMENTPEKEAAPHSASACSRAWIELDAEALRQNVEFFRARIPQHCRLMPAVKADAYGHGLVPIARLLDSMGVDAYSVACISEGIELRNAGIKGKILILGYTSPEDFPLLRRYRLTQTVVDYPYAKVLNRFGEKLHVHIGIDTGMHRIGIRCEDLEAIAAVYQLENLVVDGLFTHLCVSDSPHPQHRSFTTSQLRAFYQVIEILKENGYSCPALHILASYGILNLLPDRRDPDWQNKRPAGSRGGLEPDRLAADFVRPGIALYGVLSTTADQNVWKQSLKPVLSLKARITSIRPLHAGESVSYGITYTAALDMQIAAIAIGYADGLPRELSNGRGYVLINGCQAPIIGRICMDQCIVDISRIPNVKRGDTAVIIGRSGEEEITAAQIAETCGTITHEILTGLAARLGRVVKELV